jgi:nucleoside-diphosphate-sugar epimerase
MTTNNPQELHVVFGTGPLGRAVINALLADGHRVRAINRSGRMSDQPAGVTLAAADVHDTRQVAETTRGAAVIYQCAQPAYHRWVSEYIPLQNAIMQAAITTGARFIVGDNLYMYGDTDGAPLHEALPYAAHTRKGRVRAQAAEAVVQAHARGQLQAAIGRASDFFGPYALGSAAGDRVFGALVKGKQPSVMGDLDAPHTYTYIEDFGRALAILGTHERALGEIWHVPNAPTVSTRQFLQHAFELYGQNPGFGRMGRGMLRLGGLFIPAAREMIEMLYEFEKPFIVDDSKFKATFGDIATPLDTALRRTLDWYQKHAGLNA